MKRISITAWTLFLAIGMAAGQEKIKLGLRLEEGQTYGLKMVQEQDVRQTFMGQQQEMSQTLAVAYAFRVEDRLADGTLRITATYQDLKLRIESPLGVSEYDSQRPSEGSSELMTGFAALAGQSIGMQISAQGQILRIEGVEAILTRMIESLDMPQGPDRQELEERIKAQFGKEALLESFGNIMAIYPLHPVSVGESWTRRLSINQGLPMIFQNRWTLRQRHDGVALLDLVSQVEPNREGDAVEMAGMKLRYDMRGQQQGSIELQESSGWILRGSMALDFQGEVKVEGSDMQWPMSVKSSVRFEPYEVGASR